MVPGLNLSILRVRIISARWIRRRHGRSVKCGPEPQPGLLARAALESVGDPHFAEIRSVHHGRKLGRLTLACDRQQLLASRNVVSPDLDQNTSVHAELDHFSLLSGGSANVPTPRGGRGAIQ